MKYTKWILSALFLLGLGLSGLKAQTMYVKENSGTQTAYLLSNIKKMRFSSGNIISSKIVGSPDTNLLSGLRYLNFTDLSVNIPLKEDSTGTLLLFPSSS